MLAEWRRVLREDGRLVVSLPLPLDEIVRTDRGWVVEREVRVSGAGVAARLMVAIPRH
jgi:hypothetical protein